MDTVIRFSDRPRAGNAHRRCPRSTSPVLDTTEARLIHPVHGVGYVLRAPRS
ncbi:hypothetical protein [Saccharopolyspora sp. 5N708]|uniref:hypothetical protein n=1 Tax=Saccharopolyspora sp. 5N708 TaxID=3457424 RepID=UPI003FD10882